MKAALALITISMSAFCSGLLPFWRWTHRWRSANTGTLRGPPGTDSPWALSSRSLRHPMGISGWARNSAYFASMAFAVSPGNHLRASTSQRALLTALLVTRDGTLWIGTFAGLASWSGGKLTRYPEVGGVFVTSLLEDREGTVWAGIMGGSSDSPAGRLCAIRSGRAECYLQGWRVRHIRLEFV